MTLQKIFERGRHLLRRKKMARKLGFQYSRGRDWKLPSGIIVNNNYQEIKIPADVGTQVAFGDIFLDDCYGLTRLPFKPSRILDVGAHVGLFSLYARSLFPDSTIHAYEPNSHLKDFLHHQAQKGSFKYFLEAVGLSDGFVNLSSEVDSVQTSSQIDQNGSVPMISFRQIIQRMGGTVDVLKLDCEGAEWDILKDPESFKSVKYLCMEYHLVHGHTLQELLQILTNLQFKVVMTAKDGELYGRVWAFNAHFRPIL